MEIIDDFPTMPIAPAAHAGHGPANQFDGLIELLLPPTRDENVGTLSNEPLGAGRCQASRCTVMTATLPSGFSIMTHSIDV